MKPSGETHIIIIGGGIVGLATAVQLCGRHPGLRVTVLEKESTVAQHQTGHNSGVLHSGLYYAPGSLKARLSVHGRNLLVAFCREHGIPHEICGKVVVATSVEELPRLRELHERGTANGLPGLRLIDREELREIEPHATGVRALHVPSTGIVNYRAVSEKYSELIQQAGGEVRTASEVLGIARAEGQWRLETSSGELTADGLINCAGLHSDRVAILASHQPGVRIVPFRGEYYKLRERSWPLVKSLIYPVPDPAFPFLGVHFTRLIGGGIEAGPNAVLALDREGYRKSDFSLRDSWEIFSYPGFWKLAARYWRAGAAEIHRSFNKGAFTRALQRLVPEITEDDLEAGGTGVRAQALNARGQLVSDFQIATEEGVMHVLNAPSPAATCSLAIGEFVARRAVTAFALPPPRK